MPSSSFYHVIINPKRHILRHFLVMIWWVTKSFSSLLHATDQVEQYYLHFPNQFWNTNYIHRYIDWLIDIYILIYWLIISQLDSQHGFGKILFPHDLNAAPPISSHLIQSNIITSFQWSLILSIPMPVTHRFSTPLSNIPKFLPDFQTPHAKFCRRRYF